jgi:hypothetical protein
VYKIRKNLYISTQICIKKVQRKTGTLFLNNGRKCGTVTKKGIFVFKITFSLPGRASRTLLRCQKSHPNKKGDPFSEPPLVSPAGLPELSFAALG